MERQPDLPKTRIGEMAVPPGKDRIFLRDGKVPGFGGLKYESGRVVFIFERRIDGKPIRKMIGPLGSWTVQTAREEAMKLSRQVDTGSVPSRGGSD